MQHEGNSIHHRLSKLSSRCLFPPPFLSRFFPVIFLPYVSGFYFSTTSYLLYSLSLFSIFFFYHAFIFFLIIIIFFHFYSCFFNAYRSFVTTFISLQSFHLLLFSSVSFTPVIYLTCFHFVLYFTFFFLVFIFFFLSSSPFQTV